MVCNPGFATSHWFCHSSDEITKHGSFSIK